MEEKEQLNLVQFRDGMDRCKCMTTKPYNPTPLHERVEVWFRNLKCLPTALAINHLSKRMRNDPEYREAWKANIAMVLHDATREEHPNSWAIKGGGVSIPVRYMPIEQSAHIADRLMKHCFNA